ncbi:methyltransferase domain-containing protein [Nostoc sp. CHAB 5844]|nr:methyltransferase domain-containing protein [Nostoc sp. CHAB 5844]
MNITETVSQYYDQTLPIYQKYWYRNSESYALHYGFWEKDTKNFSESLINTNKFLANQLKIQPGDTVLDAGCGVGGSTIWLAKNFQANVIGITISEKQIQEAKRLAKANQVEHLVDFKLKNFLDTGFSDKSFDIVWGLESVCYAENKADFLQEAFRLLKSGGKIIVADGFQNRELKNAAEAEMMRMLNEGWVVPNFAKVSDFKGHLEQVGFQHIKFWDKTQAILPSAIMMYNMCRFIYPFKRIFKLFKPKSRTLEILEKNNQAGILQYKLVKSGLAAYGVFYGEKL